MKSRVIKSDNPYVMIGKMIAGIIALRFFLDINVDMSAIENIGPIINASDAVDPVKDITNDANNARAAKARNLFTHIAAQNAHIAQTIQPISSEICEPISIAGVISEQITAAMLRYKVGEVLDENNPPLATLIFNF